MFRLFVVAAMVACTQLTCAQLPNEKFGKPSKLEWEYAGWGDATGADAIILCKSMKATYQLSEQVFSNNQASDISLDNLQDFSKNDIDDSNILVKYEVRLRIKVLKAAGARHANIDITYYNADDEKVYNGDELSDLKVRVFTRNEKGKVKKTSLDTRSFAEERIDANYVVRHVVVPDVTPGSIVEYEYEITSARPAFLYDWVFQDAIPCVRSKCDIEIPAFLQFQMNVPINKLVKSGVEAGRLAYDTNRTDMKRGKTCVTNHYLIEGDYILPEGHALTHNRHDANGNSEAVQEKIATLTSRITTPGVTPPAAMPVGQTHLSVR